MDEAGAAWRALVERVGEREARDTALLSSSFAPDESWGKVLSEALEKAEAASAET